jgi:preprotein translocase subunit SecG
MMWLFLILIVIASVLLAFVVLVQNPKGGGLSGTIGGFSNQLMGVKQTTDVLEKGTWIFAGLIALLCLFSTLFISKTETGGSGSGNLEKVPTNQPVKQQPAPAQTPAPNSTTIPPVQK